MSKKFILLGLIFCSCVLVITILFLFRDEPGNKANGFTRIFINNAVNEIHSIDLEFGNYYFSGSTKNNIYLANSTASGLLLTITYPDLDTQHLFMKMPEDYRLSLPVKTFIDSPLVTILTPASGKLMTGFINDLQINNDRSLPSGFYEAIPLSNHLIAVMIYDSLNKQKDLALLNTDNDSIQVRKILQKKLDGKFDLDGQMSRDRDGNKLLFWHYYRNRYIVLDSLLSIHQLGKTIDTISQSAIELASVHRGERITFAKPPKIINSWGAISGNKVFILSPRKADNELTAAFSDKQVIDVYDWKNNQYMYSFSLPKINGSVLQQFIIRPPYLLALYPETFFIAKLSFLEDHSK